MTKKYKYILDIDGMRCGMCEAHVNDIIRRNFQISKVKSNHHKNQTIIVSKTLLDVSKLKAVILETGYVVTKIDII